MATEEEKTNAQNEQEDISIDQENQCAAEEQSPVQKELEELKDKYIRLYSEFENFRRRTAKEKIDLAKSANEDVLSAMLPVLDDFERALKSIQTTPTVEAIQEGVGLIYNKLFRTLESKGLKPMEPAAGKEFDSELQEAVTQAPAPSEDLKGKVIDEIEKGYCLNDKVIRFAKVIIGS